MGLVGHDVVHRKRLESNCGAQDLSIVLVRVAGRKAFFKQWNPIWMSNREPVLTATLLQ
jgi:hypothetical protein